MLLPACAGACVLVLALAIEKTQRPKSTRVPGGLPPSNRRNKKQTSETKTKQEVSGVFPKTPRVTQIVPNFATNTILYARRVVNV